MNDLSKSLILNSNYKKNHIKKSPDFSLTFNIASPIFTLYFKERLDEFFTTLFH
jgi:hypothetical protein